MRVGRIALFTLAGMALAGAVFALMPRDSVDARSDEEICFDLEGAVTKTVPACTALIDSGRYRGQELANIYFERGMSFRSWGKIDRASPISRNPTASFLSGRTTNGSAASTRSEANSTRRLRNIARSSGSSRKRRRATSGARISG